MNKKQLAALTASMVASVVATANRDAEDGEPELTEDEARVLLGHALKRKARALVADVCHTEPTDVVWVAVEPKKATKKATEATA